MVLNPNKEPISARSPLGPPTRSAKARVSLLKYAKIAKKFSNENSRRAGESGRKTFKNRLDQLYFKNTK
jgi:hypothetical protein